jgi:hypothetical protein
MVADRWLGDDIYPIGKIKSYKCFSVSSAVRTAKLELNYDICTSSVLNTKYPSLERCLNCITQHFISLRYYGTKHDFIVGQALK